MLSLKEVNALKWRNCCDISNFIVVSATIVNICNEMKIVVVAVVIPFAHPLPMLYSRIEVSLAS